MANGFATRNWNAHRIIGSVATVVVLIFSFVVAPAGSTYRWAFVFLLPILWIVYAIRHRIALAPTHYALFAAAILLHSLGVFNAYNRAFLYFRFDSYVHFFFGFVGGLILYRALAKNWVLRSRSLRWLVPLLILGMGGVHELFECFTTLLLGPERGMLKLRPDQPFDTQKDLFNNLLGALIAVAISRNEKH